MQPQLGLADARLLPLAARCPVDRVRHLAARHLRVTQALEGVDRPLAGQRRAVASKGLDIEAKRIEGTPFHAASVCRGQRDPGGDTIRP